MSVAPSIPVRRAIAAPRHPAAPSSAAIARNVAEYVRYDETLLDSTANATNAAVSSATRRRQFVVPSYRRSPASRCAVLVTAAKPATASANLDTPPLVSASDATNSDSAANAQAMAHCEM